MRTRTYPARTPEEARVQLKNLEHDQIHRLVGELHYLQERRRLIRLALGQFDEVDQS